MLQLVMRKLKKIKIIYNSFNCRFALSPRYAFNNSVLSINSVKCINYRFLFLLCSNNQVNCLNYYQNIE